jgi:hypothetical protein
LKRHSPPSRIATARVVPARDDPQGGVRLPGRQADHQVLRVVAGDREHAARPRDAGAREVGLEEERGHRRDQERHVADAGQRDRHRERAADVLAMHVDDLCVADRRDGDERHVETVHQRGARIADQPVAGRAGRSRGSPRTRRARSAAA